MNAILRCTLATLVVAGSLMSTNQAMASAAPKLISGELIVVDKADFFSNDAIAEAKKDFALLQSANERRVVIYTIKELPEGAKTDFAKRSSVNEKRDFWRQFTNEQAKSDKKADVFILICRSPGHVQVIGDETMRKGGFNDTEELAIAKLFLDKFKEASGKPAKDATALHDQGLLAAVKELHRNLPITLAQSHNQTQGHTPAKEGTGMGIMGYVCIGLAILAGLWLIFGVIRAFTGGGGGMGGGGGGGMGGGGGGGFMSSLMGGLFGSMAGMWLYDNMLGGHTSSAFGSSNTGVDNNNDTGSGPADEPGRGDFSGDQGAGGDYDDNSGGGDNGGGGGDWGGGGGDFGGGGGDFGGGGGDFGGGGGDF